MEFEKSRLAGNSPLRADTAAPPPEGAIDASDLKDGAIKKAAGKLLRDGFIEEIPARGSLPTAAAFPPQPTIQATHTRLAAALAATKPHHISVYRVADRTTLRNALTKVLEAVKVYAVACVDDTADSASLGVSGDADEALQGGDTVAI